MRTRHIPGGIIGVTELPNDGDVGVQYMDATKTLTGDPKMSGDDDNVQMILKKEFPIQIVPGDQDRSSITTCSSTVAHCANGSSYSCLLIISSGQLAQPNINGDRAMELGAGQLRQFEASWAESFRNSLSKQVITFAEKKKRLSVVEEYFVILSSH